MKLSSEKYVELYSTRSVKNLGFLRNCVDARHFIGIRYLTFVTS